MNYTAYEPTVTAEQQQRIIDSRLKRFESKIRIEDDCLIWTGWTNGKGYGGFFNGTKQVYAHRWNYERVRGPIPDGLVLDHLCRNRKCVNPDHLEAVTVQQNILRGDQPLLMSSRRRPDPTLCGAGLHPWVEENILSTPYGNRCRACKRKANHRYKQRKQGT